MRWLGVVLFAILIVDNSAFAQSQQYRRPLAPTPEECPQGHDIRAHGAYPSTMTDCEVLDADTKADNLKRQRGAAIAQPVNRQAVVAAPVQVRGTTYQQVAVSPCAALLNAYGTPAFGDIGDAIVGFVNSRTGLGNSANVEDYILTECRLHEDIPVGQAVANIFDQQKRNRLPRIPIGDATDSPAVQASWLAFGKWIHHQGDPPNFRLVDAAERTGPSTTAFTDTLVNPSRTPTLVILLAILVVYFLPTMVAVNRGHHNKLAIFMLNQFLGWTFIGWVAALVWACTETKKSDLVEAGDVLLARQEPRL